jgi:hypothetical protein
MRPADVRAEAARQLRLSVQRFSKRLSADQLAGLSKLAASVEDSALREEAARLAATFGHDASAEGNRLRQFNPAAPKAPAPPPQPPQQ